MPDPSPSLAPPGPAASGPAPGRSPLRGVALLAVAVLLFAAMDTTTKYLVARYDASLVVAARYIGHFLLMLAILGPFQRGRLVATRRPGLVFLRAASLVLASLFVALALRRMPVAETSAIFFLAPMIVVLVAPVLLGERFSAANAFAAGLGFVGVLLIVRPGSGLPLGPVALALAAAGLSSCYMLLSRLLASTETTVALLFHTALVGSVAFGITLPWSIGGPVPTPLVAGLFLATGVLGGLGHYLLTAAHRLAPASLLAPVNYIQLFWAGLLGWAVFGHVPDHASIAGMAIVVIAGVMIAARSSRGRGG